MSGTTRPGRRGLELELSPAGKALVGKMVGTIRLVERLAAGGMGEVYLGNDERLGRKVAVKAIRHERRLGADSKARFLREAQILSQLEHPNICRVYDYVEAGGDEFIVLELVRGRSLREVMAVEPTWQQKMSIANQVIHALIAAHSMTIVHRDLKPENIMVTPEWEVKVLDFGLARTGPAQSEEATTAENRQEAEEGAGPSDPEGATHTGQGTIIGTPRYMCPEQARGEPMTAASDIYSFGLLLQELFTGADPYGAEDDIAKICHRASWGDREPIHGIDSHLAALIESLTAILPRQRPTAEAAAQQLQWIWNKPRRRVRRLAVATIAAIVLAAAVISTAGFVRAQRARLLAEQQQAATLAEGARAAMAAGDPLEARAKLRESLELQDSSLGRATWWQLQHSPLFWSTRLNAAVMGVAFSPDSTRVAAASGDGSVVLFDVQTRERRVLRGADTWLRAVAFSPDGNELFSVSNMGRIGIWNLHTGTVRYIEGERSDLLEVCGGTRCPPTQGTLIATSGADGAILLWDTATGSLVRSFDEHPADHFRFSPDGHLLASSAVTGGVRLYETTSGSQLWQMVPAGDEPRDIQFTPDGARLALSSPRGIHLLETDTGEEVAVFVQGGIVNLSFLPSGEILASTGADASLTLWDVKTGSPAATYFGHESWIHGLDASPDGRFVASSSEDGSVRLWRTDLRRELPQDRGHTAEGFGLVFSPDGSVLFSSARDQTVRSWEVATGRPLGVFDGHSSTVYAVDCSESGDWLGSAGDSTVRLWRRPLRPWSQPSHVLRMPGAVFDLAFTRNDSGIVAVSNDGTLRMWNLTEGLQSRQLPPHVGEDQMLRIGPNGRWLASGDSSSGIVRLWDLERSIPGPTWNSGVHNAAGMCFTSDGKNVVLGDASGAVHLWSIDDQESRIDSFPDHRVVTVCAHPSGAICMLSSRSHSMVLRNLESGKVIHLERSSMQSEAAASADGKRLATIGNNGVVNLWDMETGHPLWRTVALLHTPFELLTHRGWLSLDGTGQRGAAERRWRAALEDRAMLADQSEDGRWLCVLDHHGTVELWNVATDSQVWRQTTSGAVDLEASGSSCVVRSSAGPISLIRGSGDARILATQGTATAVDSGQIFVASSDTIRVHDGEGTLVSTQPTVRGVTSVGVAREYLAVGTETGGLTFVPRGTMGAPPTCDIEDAPPSPVERIVIGPQSTIIAGFADGSLAIWNLENGDLLYRTHLNGAVRHLMLRQHLLAVATEAGDFETIDMRVFSRQYCDVMREVWNETEVVWEGGRPSRQPIPRDHVCAR